MIREELHVRLDGVQGVVVVGGEEHQDHGALVWLTLETNDDDETVSVGVDPNDLRAAIAFVMGRDQD